MHPKPRLLSPTIPSAFAEAQIDETQIIVTTPEKWQTELHAFL